MKLLKNYYLYVLVFIGIFVLGYYETIIWWIGRCTSPDSYYSHGFLIPFVSAYLVWEKRNELKEVESEFSITGLIIFIFACILHFLGTVLYIFSISGFSVFFLVLGAVLFLFGKEKTKIILFPILFLLFMFPLPLAIVSAISWPLKVFVAKLSAGIISWLGIPIFLDGFNITIPAGSLVVGNPCSGLRSLISFFAIGALLSYMSNLSRQKKIILFLLSVPIAIFSNIIRVSILIFISDYKGIEAAAPDTLVHTGSGVLMFIIGLMFFFIIHKLFGD